MGKMAIQVIDEAEASFVPCSLRRRLIMRKLTSLVRLPRLEITATTLEYGIMAPGIVLAIVSVVRHFAH